MRRFVSLFVAVCIVMSAMAVNAQAQEPDAPVPVPSPQKQTGPKSVSPEPVEESSQAQDAVETVKPEPPPNLVFKSDPTCEARLRELGVVFEKTGPVKGEPGCGFEEAYGVIEIAPGVGLTPKTQLRCEAVLSLARWVREMVVPAFDARSKQNGRSDAETPDRLTRINHASSYVCRRRNNQPDGKLSWHALGAAIDIASFESTSGKVLPVKPRGTESNFDAALQKTLRSSACLYFTTVLGPGSDGYHEDHLHLDIAQRRGDYRLCN